MATYYVDPVNGNNTWDGLSPTFVSGSNGPWASTQKAADTAVAGDEVRLMATGTETLALASIDLDTNSGTQTNPISFVGADANGDPLTTGHYTIDANNSASNCLNCANTVSHTRWRRVRFTNAASNGINIPSGGSHVLEYCRVDGHGASGVLGGSSVSTITALGCEFDSNTDAGLRQTTNSRLNLNLSACRIHDNGGAGIDLGNECCVERCEIYDNGGVGIELDGGGTNLVTGCTIYGNSSHGIYIDGSEHLLATNNSLTANGGYGISFNSLPQNAQNIIAHNHYHGNTSGEWSTGSSTEDGKQTGDPQFASVVDGSEDFTPADGSPLDGTGLNGTDIGAIGTADPAGGGATTRAYAL